MNGVDVHRPVSGILQYDPPLPGESVRPLDRLCVPVRPEHVFLKECHGEGVWHTSLYDHMAITAVKIREPDTEK